MKILTLRIYNSTPDYDEMYKLHKKFDKNSVFLTASPSVTEPVYDTQTNILTVPGNECLIPGILYKTIKGIEYCLKHFEFDILVRSNMSTIIDYTELEKQLSNISSPIYGGHVWSYVIMKNFVTPTRFSFISGCCTVMDRDVCAKLISGNFMYNLYDDVAIGYYLSKLYPITYSTQYDETCKKQSGSCFYRFRKDITRYDQREKDIENIKHFYQLLTE